MYLSQQMLHLMFFVTLLSATTSACSMPKSELNVSTQTSPVTIELVIAANSTVTQLSFVIEDVNAGRLQLLARSPLSDHDINLEDPQGQLRISADDLIVQPRNQVSQPQLGDNLLFPEIRDPPSGKWTLTVRHAESSEPKTVRLTLALFTRFNLSMHIDKPNFVLGESIILHVNPSEYGETLSNYPTQIDVLHNGKSIDTLEITDKAIVSNNNIPLSTDSQDALAVYTPSEAGKYTFIARSQFHLNQQIITQQAQQNTVVQPAQAYLRETRLQPQSSSSGCTNYVVVLQDVEIEQAGLYTLTGYFLTDNKPLSQSTTQQLIVGHQQLAISFKIKNGLMENIITKQGLDYRAELLLTTTDNMTIVAKKQEYITPPISCQN
ncbi:hypothetical protein [Paraglaciecola sp.]|uniref:hypothetical protein n=1 Tax=Paraglaciecola sp. TaxID=1920173 RepID=UPI0030F46CA7